MAAAETLIQSIDATFQSYADRGVFRGFTIDREPRGVRMYRFQWLTRRPMTVRLAARQSTLTFVDLFPSVRDRPEVVRAIAKTVSGRLARGIPAHKRLDGRRVAIRTGMRQGTGWVRIDVKGRHGEYAVRTALGVINDLFLVLHECHPEYLVAHFGVSSE